MCESVYIQNLCFNVFIHILESHNLPMKYKAFSFNVHIHILEFHILMTRYGAFTLLPMPILAFCDC